MHIGQAVLICTKMTNFKHAALETEQNSLLYCPCQQYKVLKMLLQKSNTDVFFELFTYILPCHKEFS